MAAGLRGVGQAERVLRVLPWVVIALGVVIGRMIGSYDTSRSENLVIGLGGAVLLVILSLRLLLEMVQYPGRRPVLVPLFVGLVLWMVASVALSSAQVVGRVSFPSSAEWVFLAAYLAFATFVILDARATPALRSAVAWTDAVIICGTAGVVVSAFVVAPVALAYPEGGYALLTALIFPLLDALLALIVIGQWALRLRRDWVRTALLAGGFLMMAIADTSLGAGVSSGGYQFSQLADLLWAVALVLIVEGACRRPDARRSSVFTGASTGLIMADFAVALLILVVRPPGAVGVAIVASAALVLAAAGVRLLLSLREANRINEALQDAVVDHTTGLPSRRALAQRLNAAIASGRQFGFLLLDIDHFTELNDALGHEGGDYLLQVVAGRAAEVAPSGSLLGRMGGDEFGIVVNTSDPVVLGSLGEAIRDFVAAPMGIDGVSVTARVSVGITTGRTQDVSASDVFRRADLAQLRAKQSVGVMVFDEDEPSQRRAELELAAELRAALRNGDLIVRYLPIVRANSGEVVRVEALVRWEHPALGELPPMRFLPIARREGLSSKVTQLVVDRVSADVRRWWDAGLHVGVSVNISAHEMIEPDIAQSILRPFANVGLDPRRVTVEVTEDVYRQAPELARQAILDLRSAGLRLSVDDFGAGSSSLSSLRDLPFDEVKLDRSFFASVMSDPRSAVIVQNAVAMAHALGNTVVAVGVESDAVAARAIVLGVDMIQGFALTMPLKASDVPDFVRSVEVARRV